jgi:hypothetical protein
MGKIPKNKIQRLDDFNKILIATGQINYLASCLDGVNSDIRFIPDPEGWHKEGIQTREYVLRDVRQALYDLMERMADLMNNTGCISPIDVRVSKEAFKVVSGQNDNVEK